MNVRNKLRNGWAMWVLGSVMGWILPVAGETPGTAGTNRVVTGFSHRRDTDASVPWSIQVVQMERGNADYELLTTMGNGTRFGLITLTEQIRAIPAAWGRPLAGVNGDFYQNEAPYEGDPKGLQIIRGELVSGPSDWSCFWMDPGGVPHMGRVVSQFAVSWGGGEWVPLGLNEDRGGKPAVLYTRAIGASTRTSGGREFVLEAEGGVEKVLHPSESYVLRVRQVANRGDTAVPTNGWVLSLGPQVVSKGKTPEVGETVKLTFATTPNLRGVQTAIGGGPALIHEGKILQNWRTPHMRHPRTAMGWDKRWIYLVQVDGRQIGFSAGMTFGELADYMLKLGCEEALNLDGGGSSSCWVLGAVRNNPSEGRERGVANGLIVMQKPKRED